MISATFRRYESLLGAQLRVSWLLALRYRLDFIAEGIMSAFWSATAVVPLLVIYARDSTIPGWSFPEALLVSAFFTMLTGVIEGAISPSLTQIVELVRRGSLDYVLLKPADTQFLVSTSRLLPWRATSILTAIVMMVVAFRMLHQTPAPLDIVVAVWMFVLAVAMLYSFWISVVSTAFYFVKVDNLSYLFTSIFDAARWPASVFRGALSVAFTFVIPLALMTTYPALALLGRVSPTMFVASTLGTVAALLVSRAIWNRALASYRSASS